MPVNNVGFENSGAIELRYGGYGSGRPVILVDGHPLSSRAGGRGGRCRSAHPRHRDRRRRRRPAGRAVGPQARRRADHPHGRHPGRTRLGRGFGATDVVSARGTEGITAARDLAGGYGSEVVIEAVGTLAAYQQAIGIARPGGVISRVGVPQYEEAPVGWGSLFRHNIRLAGGPAPTRAYMAELLPDILNGTIAPGKVFDASTSLDGVPAGYRDMADRTALKVLIRL